MTKIRRLLLMCLLLLLAIASWHIKYPSHNPIDNAVQAYFSKAMQQALTAYASVRLVNATVSVIQHSELQLEPGGLGVSIAAGQALDPINDMAERLSDILVISIVSLGVQQVAYQVVSTLSFKLIAMFAAGLLACWCISTLLRCFYTEPTTLILDVWHKFQRFLWQLMVGLLLLRCLFIANASISSNFETVFVEPALVAAQADLQLFEQASSLSPAIEPTGLFDKAKSIGHYSAKLKALTQTISTEAERIITALLSMTWWVLSSFLLNAVLLPILSICIVWKILRGMGLSR